MQGHVPNVWDLKERNWLQAEEEPGRCSNWDAKVSEVKPPLNQTLCILVKFTQDLRLHFQSCCGFFFFFFLSMMHILWQLLPIWNLWSQLFVVTWDCFLVFFPCWPQAHHSNPPEQHQSSLEFWQKSFFYITAAQCKVHTTWTSPPQVIFATDFLLFSLWCMIWGEHCRETSTAVLSSVWKPPQSWVPLHASFMWKNPKQH